MSSTWEAAGNEKIKVQTNLDQLKDLRSYRRVETGQKFRSLSFNEGSF